MTPTGITPYQPITQAREAQMRAMQRAGVGLIRQSFDVHWPTAQLDADVLDAARHHIRILALLLDGSRLQVRPGHNHGFFPPRSFGAFARRAAVLVRRYGSHGTLWRTHATLRRFAIRDWQVWNEPNLPVWWRPRPRPASYAHLVGAVSRAVHRADRHAVVISAGFPNSGLSWPLSYDRYLAGFLRAGGGRAVQAVGLHGYASTIAGFEAIVRTFRRVMAAHHAAGKALWITEVGWADRGPANRFVVGSRGQAARITGLYRLLGRLRGPGRIHGIVYFQWRDERLPPGHGDTWGYHTGLLRRDGRAKPALAAWRRVVRALRRP